VTLDTSGTIPRLRFRNRETYMSTKTAEYDDQVMRLSSWRRVCSALGSAPCGCMCAANPSPRSCMLTSRASELQIATLPCSRWVHAVRMGNG